MDDFYLLWNRLNFCLVVNCYHSFFPLIQHRKHMTTDFAAFYGLARVLSFFPFSLLQVISPLILERGILYLKRACFGLWLIERGILNLKHAKWLENRGLRNRGEMTGYLFLSSSPFIVLNFSCLGKGEKNVLQDLAAGSPHPHLSTYYPIRSEAYTELLITLTCLAAKIWQKSSVTRLYEK